MLRFRVFRKCWLGTSSVRDHFIKNGPGKLTYLRRLRQAIMALASALCILLSLSFYKHYDPKTDLCVLIAVPGLCLVASVTACVSSSNLLSVLHLICVFVFHKRLCNTQKQSFFAKGLFRSSIPTSVAVECIWTTCFVIFNLSALSRPFP
ncbi:hypothetical protein EDB86DRAFT_1004360 [Lactarius hatsudake]|nr:hypothetical protein EDB86DRAFT_1004360 [Lactarius hatsudake]